MQVYGNGEFVGVRGRKLWVDEDQFDYTYVCVYLYVCMCVCVVCVFVLVWAAVYPSDLIFY